MGRGGERERENEIDGERDRQTQTMTQTPKHSLRVVLDCSCSLTVCALCLGINRDKQCGGAGADVAGKALDEVDEEGAGAPAVLHSITLHYFTAPITSFPPWRRDG